ncbi:MAG: DUF3617 family protein [Nitrospirae bacterium]|nr:DUF3617 family protein [Nitrospirota bacterium]
MKVMLSITAAGLFLLALHGAAWSAAPDIQYGQWEITMTMEGGMMPQPMSFTSTQCLTKENYLPNSSPQQGKNPCTIKKMSVKGDTVVWAAECPMEGGGTANSQGEVTYRRTTYDGTIRTTMTTQGQQMTMVMKMKGRRIGECK